MKRTSLWNYPKKLQDVTDDIDVILLFKMVEDPNFGSHMLGLRKNDFTPLRRMRILQNGEVSGVDYIKKVFGDEIDEALAVSDCNCLVACSGVSQQVRHSDLSDSDEHPPSDNYVVFVSILKGTKLLAFDDMKISSVIVLNEGDAFVGRGDLLHAGAAYLKYNVRLHFYNLL